MKHLATIVEAVGTIMVAVSLAVLHPAAGLGFAGVALIAFGIAAERSQ